MKSIASAPGKIILFGEHFVVHGTPAILAAIDKRVTVTSSFTENKTIKVNSQLGTIEVPISSSHEEVESEFRPFVYLANKIINSNQNVGGLEITIDSDIPIGVGLGSSSACCVAAAASIYGLVKELSAEALVIKSYDEIMEMSIEAEKTIFPDTSGADCTVCTYGGIVEYFTKGIFATGRRFNVHHLTSTKKDLNLVIANSMIPHSTKRSVEKVSEFKECNEERFSELCVLETKLIDEAKIALKLKNLTILGLKMSENQKYLEEIEVSNDTLRDMISSLNEISLGSKITGAGDGGCIIALVKDENVSKVPKLVHHWNYGKHALLGKAKECSTTTIDTKGIEWKREK